MKKALIIICSVIVVLLAAGAIYLRPMYQRFIAVDVVRHDPQLTIFIGGGANSIMLVSEDGGKALLVDPKMGPGARKMKAAVKAGHIIIVNTHAHPDHTAGNGLYPGAKIIAGAYSKEQWALDSDKGRYPDRTIKPGEELKITIGGETAVIRNMGRAHTWNDVVVYLEKRRLLVTGDVVFLDMHPVLFEQSGSSVASWIEVLDMLVKRYDITTLVPGHGRVSGNNALTDMRGYFTTIAGSSGDPVKQAGLKKKYGGYFSLPKMSGFGMTLAFIEKERSGR